VVLLLVLLVQHVLRGAALRRGRLPRRPAVRGGATVIATAAVRGSYSRRIRRRLCRERGAEVT
jgi:hypothetical protein